MTFVWSILLFLPLLFALFLRHHIHLRTRKTHCPKNLFSIERVRIRFMRFTNIERTECAFLKVNHFSAMTKFLIEFMYVHVRLVFAPRKQIPTIHFGFWIYFLMCIIMFMILVCHLYRFRSFCAVHVVFEFW